LGQNGNSQTELVSTSRRTSIFEFALGSSDSALYIFHSLFEDDATEEAVLPVACRVGGGGGGEGEREERRELVGMESSGGLGRRCGF